MLTFPAFPFVLRASMANRSWCKQTSKFYATLLRDKIRRFLSQSSVTPSSPRPFRQQMTRKRKQTEIRCNFLRYGCAITSYHWLYVCAVSLTFQHIHINIFNYRNFFNETLSSSFYMPRSFFLDACRFGYLQVYGL